MKLLRSLAIGAFVGTASLLVATSAYAVPVLSFKGSNTTGSITYSGTAGTPLVGTGIGVDFLVATGTSANGAYPCVGCVLDFTTGGNTLEGPPTWTFAAGGSFTITGAVTGIVGPTTLLSGTFTDVVNLVRTGASANAFIVGLGIDSKDPTLAAFFGLGPNGWDFSTSLHANPVTFDTSTGAFSGTRFPDLNTANTKVPEPGTLGLLGGSLVALGLVTSWRRKRAARPAVAEDVATV